MGGPALSPAVESRLTRLGDALSKAGGPMREPLGPHNAADGIDLAAPKNPHNQPATPTSAETDKVPPCERPWRITDFDIGGPIGRGTLGSVYLATEIRSGLPVAMKALKKKKLDQYGARGRVRAEIEAQCTLRHAGLLRLHGFFHDDRRIYLVLEHAAGGELRSVLRRERTLTEEVAARLTVKVACALAFLHSRGVVHGAIRPENLYLDRRDLESAEIKIGRLGCVRPAAATGATGHVTPSPPRAAPARHGGSAGYVAPEMKHGEGDVEVDGWALGALICEMILGAPPSLSDSPDPTLKFPPTARRTAEGRVRALSAPARDLVCALLRAMPADRLSVVRVPCHAWCAPFAPPDWTQHSVA